jgi:glycosyltransferase involved in cell wall biosynthesis
VNSYSNDVNERARRALEENRVAIFIVAYNAERHIKKVLERIPTWVTERLAEIFVIDDHSNDNTFKVAANIEWPSQHAPLRIFRTPYNQGYGGNQRLGYLYAIERGFDIVVLLHGDGQYAPFRSSWRLMRTEPTRFSAVVLSTLVTRSRAGCLCTNGLATGF